MRLFFLMLLSTVSFSFVNDECSFKYKGGVVYLNGERFIFVHNIHKLDTVYGMLEKRENGIAILKSSYSPIKLNDCSLSFSESNTSDSVRIEIMSNSVLDYPIAFFIIHFKNRANSFNSISDLYGNYLIDKHEVGTLFFDLFGAKSDLYSFQSDNIPDTLVFKFDYLYPREIKRYTFLNDTINICEYNRKCCN